ncbi:MAG: hypothetical protein QOD00_2812 [Blastocatellia bacterium]|nr:hypothetical protein [Blastocatellia bacterium]
MLTYTDAEKQMMESLAAMKAKEVNDLLQRMLSGMDELYRQAIERASAPHAPFQSRPPLAGSAYIIEKLNWWRAKFLSLRQTGDDHMKEVAPVGMAAFEKALTRALWEVDGRIENLQDTRNRIAGEALWLDQEDPVDPRAAEKLEATERIKDLNWQQEALDKQAASGKRRAEGIKKYNEAVHNMRKRVL